MAPSGSSARSQGRYGRAADPTLAQGRSRQSSARYQPLRQPLRSSEARGSVDGRTVLERRPHDLPQRLAVADALPPGAHQRKLADRLTDRVRAYAAETVQLPLGAQLRQPARLTLRPLQRTVQATDDLALELCCLLETKAHSAPRSRASSATNAPWSKCSAPLSGKCSKTNTPARPTCCITRPTTRQSGR